MLRYLVRRLIWVVVVLLGVSIITYALTYLMPGDPARRMAGPGATPEIVRGIRHQLGLDRPFWVQYGTYMRNLLHGDFGYSFVQNVAVLPSILAHFSITAWLALGGIFVELLIGLPTGVISAYKRASLADRSSTLFALIGLSAPPFWLGLILIYYLAYVLPIFPLGGYAEPGSATPAIMYLILPSFTLGIGGAAVYTRTFRSTILDVLDQPYIRMARAKGMSERVILFRHVFPNAIVPIVTQIGIDIGYFLGGVFIIEYAYSLPGIGKQAIDAIAQLDIPIILGTVLFTSFLIVVCNIVVDISLGFIDPRIRYQ